MLKLHTSGDLFHALTRLVGNSWKPRKWVVVQFSAIYKRASPTHAAYLKAETRARTSKSRGESWEIPSTVEFSYPPRPYV